MAIRVTTDGFVRSLYYFVHQDLRALGHNRGLVDPEKVNHLDPGLRDLWEQTRKEEWTCGTRKLAIQYARSMADQIRDAAASNGMPEYLSQNEVYGAKAIDAAHSGSRLPPPVQRAWELYRQNRQQHVLASSADCAIMKPEPRIAKLCPELQSVSKKAIEIVGQTKAMITNWIGFEPKWLAGKSQIEIYPLVEKTDKKAMLNALCQNDKNDRDQDGDCMELTLNFQFDSQLRDQDGRLFASIKDPRIVAHETGHALFWSIMGFALNDEKNMSFLEGMEILELAAVDEAVADIAALMHVLGDKELLAQIEKKTGADLLQSNFASRPCDYLIRPLKNVLVGTFFLNELFQENSSRVDGVDSVDAKNQPPTTADEGKALLEEKIEELELRVGSRDLSKVSHVDSVSLEFHEKSQVLSSAVYQVLAALVKMHQSQGVSFAKAVSLSREIVGKVFFKTAADFAKNVGEDMFSFSHFASALIERTKMLAPETEALWVEALTERGIEIRS